MTHRVTICRVAIMIKAWSLQREPLSSLVKCYHRPKLLDTGEHISKVDICQICSIETLHLENEFNNNIVSSKFRKYVLLLK